MKNEAKHMSGSKLTGQEISVYFRKNPKAKAVKKAVEIALDHGGAMTYAVKEIEKLKKGLSKHPEVKKALRWANESTHSIARDTFAKIVTENYTKNFELLCQSLKFNKIQQRILDQFISHGTIKNQYVGRVAGRKKETKIFAAKKKYTGSLESRKGALMQALKVNAKQKNILDAYLNTGRVIGKYAGSVAGSTKTTKDYTAFRGFKESYELLEVKGSNVEIGATVKMGKLYGKVIRKVKYVGKPGVEIRWSGLTVAKVFFPLSSITSLSKDKKADYSIREGVDFDEAQEFWKVTVIKPINKLKKGQNVRVKARNAAEALKKGAKRLGDPIANQSGYLGAVKEDIATDGSVMEATGREITIDWDMDDPREYKADWQDVGVYLDDWNKKKMEIDISGTEKDLLNWLADDYGMDKKNAQLIIRKGKKIKL